MLRTLQYQALLLGFGAGTAIASLVAVAGWALLAALGDDNSLTGPIITGVLSGMVGAGYVGARLSRRKLFHGTLAALAFGFGVSVAAILAGSPATPLSQTWFLLLSATLGMVGAFIGASAK